jgi:hypothetical protein
MDEAGKFTAEHTVMEAGMEIRELKHLLVIAEDKIKKLEAEIVRLKSLDYPKSEEGLILHFDEPLHSVASEKYNDFGISFSDKSQLDSDDEEPNNESY